MKPSLSIHKQTYIEVLTEAIRKKAYDENMPLYTASVRVVLEWLSYEPDDVHFIDSQDNGIDAWVDTESGIELFQIKTHELNDIGFLTLTKFDQSGVGDLRRARDFLLYEQLENIKRDELKQLLYRWSSALRSAKLQGQDFILPVTLHLIVLGAGLTDQAMKELIQFQESLVNPAQEDNVPIQFTAVLHTVDDIIDGRWREENREWIDKDGKACESVELSPNSADGYISDNVNAVFYCRAKDLVVAYDTLGYQLFEPNVRANIKKSRVNKDIANSVKHQRTRKDFRFLNNGVTITCSNFKKPTQHKPSFVIRQPGVVNGLQTVVALHTAYHELDQREREDFERNCHVLVRLLSTSAVSDITTVVKATNNQNPMKIRNLVSNNLEQLTLSRLFAERNWFYEAKEGAWDAFEKDPRRWRPDLKKRAKDFKIGNSRRVRRLDNEKLAQVWLAFIGFSPDAVNKKRELFEDRYYPLIFTKWLPQHGTYYETVTQAIKDTLDDAPNHFLMLAAYLARDFAQEMTPSAVQNRQDTCARLNIDPSKYSKAELDVLLYKDNTFTLIQALNGMSMLFVEFLGFVLYQALKEDLRQFGLRILQNGSFSQLATTYSVDGIAETINDDSFPADDLLVVLWLAFTYKVEDMLLSGWGDSYRAATVKVRYIFSNETRNRLYREVEALDKYMKTRPLTQVWAKGVQEGQGLFDYVRDIVLYN